MQDIDEELGYDADHDDTSQYCAHGTWIGSWWGPDYMCFACEMGISVRALEAQGAANAARCWRDRIKTATIRLELVTAWPVGRPPTDREVQEVFDFVNACNLLVDDALREHIEELYDGIPEDEFGC